jgi:penicillin-binding protein 1A
MMRAVIDKGTGRAIRKQYGIRADVAGKTGTTQGNADGWFILMHPQIVAGAWAGFNDARITLKSDQWGQGSRSALPMVGDFMSRALRSPLLNAKARFTEPNTSHWWSDLVGRLRDKVQEWSGPADEGHPHADDSRTSSTQQEQWQRGRHHRARPQRRLDRRPAGARRQQRPAARSGQQPRAGGEMMPAPARPPAFKLERYRHTTAASGAPLNAPQDSQ